MVIKKDNKSQGITMSELRGSLNKFFELKPELKIIFINIVLKIFLNETKKFKQQKRAHF